ncbi:MAG: TetR/AcrR family transcriptional regulator [Lewinellaceae bacterium]|nr:TetR/AcrR family transcriptional regulator [Lewinellaceae bacterium]
MTERSVKKYMAPKTAKQLEKAREDKKVCILEAALKVFASHGYDGASISMIAREAKISKGLLYTYYESKEHLLEQLMIWGLERAGSTTNVEAGYRIGSEEEFMYGLKMIIAMVQQEADFWRLYNMVVMQPKMADRFKDKAKSFLEDYLQVYVQYFEDKKVPDPMAEAIMFGAVIDGILFDMLMVGETEYPLERVLEVVRRKFA